MDIDWIDDIETLNWHWIIQFKPLYGSADAIDVVFDL